MPVLPNFAYFKGRIVPYSEAKVGVMTHALNYGTGCFGGVRGYWNDDENQLLVFRPHDHMRRFLSSSRLLLMELGLNEEQLVNLILDLLRAEDRHEDMYVRPLAFKGDSVVVRSRRKHETLVGQGPASGADSSAGEWHI